MLKLKNLSKLILVLAIFALTFTSLFALNHTMSHDKNGKMSSCILMDKNMNNNCQMSIIEHLLKWQSLFFATLESFALPIFVALVTILPLAYTKNFGLDPPPLFKNSYQFQVYLQKLHDHIKEGLSRGILNPKVYVA